MMISQLRLCEPNEMSRGVVLLCTSRNRYKVKPHLCSLFFIGLALTATPPLHAGAWSAWCSRLAARLVKVSPPRLTAGSWLQDRVLQAKLRKILAEELVRIRPGAEKYLGALPPGSRISVAGAEFTVVAFLGDGYHGAVYLADGPTGRKAVKQFKVTIEMLNNLKVLEKMAEDGVPTAKVWEVDEVNKTAVLDYVEGLSVSKLLNSSGPLGLSLAEREQIQKHFDQFERLVLPFWPQFKNQNIIMDFNSGEFIVIDPS